MLYTTRTGLSSYRGIHPNLDIAIDFLAACDLSTLAQGKNPVDGDKVFINRFDYHTANVADKPFETHLRYADIHLLLSGKEMIAVADIHAHTETERDESTDYIGTRGISECDCLMTPDKALVIWPLEAHRSMQIHQTDCDVHKVVCKVLMQPV